MCLCVILWFSVWVRACVLLGDRIEVQRYVHVIDRYRFQLV